MTEPERETTLDGSVAVITGASSGIGEACARLLAASGVHLVLVARRAERLASIVEALGEDCAQAMVADVTDPSTARGALDRAIEAFGRCDIVINNAASFAVGPIEKLTADRVCDLARTNVEAAYRVAFEAVTHFKQVGRGHLVNLSSISGTKVPRAGIGWYAGTKHALEALSESLRMECADTGVRITAVEPGMTQTEIFAEPITSISRPLDPGDVAEAVRFALTRPGHVSIPRVMILPSAQAI